MSKTTFDPKISSVGSQNEAASPANETVPGNNVQIAGDVYTNAQADPYKRLFDGKPKAAETSLIGEMLGEFDNLAVNKPRRDPMQDFLDGFVFGRGPAKAKDFELPKVPRFYMDIMRNLPGVKIEAVIQKFRDLKKVIRNLKNTAENRRKAPLAALKMRTDELRALTNHIRQLDAQLIKCETELAQARAYKADLDSRPPEARNA